MTANDNTRALSQDDKANLDDVRDVRAALEIALEALRKAMEGKGSDNRDQFTFQIGFAVGRLGRVQARIYPAREDPHAA
jgi:hypothetical protein